MLVGVGAVGRMPFHDAPNSKGAPALGGSWRMPRTLGSTDDRRRRSIKCYLKYWGEDLLRNKTRKSGTPPVPEEKARKLSELVLLLPG